MQMLIVILLVIAAISFFAAAAGATFGRLNLIGVGLFAWVLTVLIPAALH